MSNQAIRRAKKDKDNPYKSMRRATFEDDTLSFEARGVLGYILVKPDDWQINIADLMKQGNIGRDKTYRILNELIEAGYCERIEVRDRGRISGYEYLIQEEPLPEKPYTVDLPLPDLPLTAEPLTENTDHTNKEKVLNNNPTKEEKEGVGGTLETQELREGDYVFREELKSLSMAMLQACGLFAETAAKFANEYPFEALREWVIEWRADPHAGAGALKHRIENNRPRGRLLDSDYVDDFYLRYRTPEELARDSLPIEDASSEAEPVRQPPAWHQAISVDSEHHRAWLTLLSDLELCVKPSIYASWLRDTVPISTAGDAWCIGVPSPQSLDWLRNRMAARIERTLSMIAHQPITLEFQVMSEVAP